MLAVPDFSAAATTVGKGVSEYVVIDRWTLSEELWLFGEDALHPRPLEMSDPEMAELYRLAGHIHVIEGRARSGSEAAALALVQIADGRPRPLARRRRRPRSQLPAHDAPRADRLDEIFRIGNAPGLG